MLQIDGSVADRHEMDESLSHAAAAIEQERYEDALLFLRDGATAAWRRGDRPALREALALARVVPGEEAATFAAQLEAAVAESTSPSPPSRTRLIVLLSILAWVSLTGALRLASALTDPPSPSAEHISEEERPPALLHRPGAYLVPVGRFDEADPERIAAYLEEVYDIDARVLPAVKLRPRDFDPIDEELELGGVQSAAGDRYDAQRPQTVIVALTDFGARPYPHLGRFSLVGKETVAVSSARLGPGILDRVLGRDPTEARIRRLVAREVGVALYGRELSDRGFELEPITSLAEIDAIDEDLPLGMEPPRGRRAH